MARRRYVVTYDIRDDARLRRVHKTMKGFGYALQYSVFLCDLDNIEKYDMLRALGDVVHQQIDSVAIIDLGDADGRGVTCFEFLGPHAPLPRGGPRIV